MNLEQVLYKQRYSISEFNTILYQVMRTIKYMRKAKRAGKLSGAFIKRIMLAVTEVNGCEICSYVHTKQALEMGMNEDDIQQILTGDLENIPQDEVKAIMFAQHYAETKGNPSEESWNKIVETYGDAKALGILGAIRMITFGNSFGIALSAFRSRLKGIKVESSSLVYEVSMLVSLLPLVPLNIVRAMMAKLKKEPIIEFSS